MSALQERISCKMLDTKQEPGTLGSLQSTEDSQDSWGVGKNKSYVEGSKECQVGLADPRVGSHQVDSRQSIKKLLDLSGARVPRVEQQV
jgi:hypothetical protein